ncbi:MAG: pilus assembly protein PilM [Thermodesulfovibrionales bacterium]|nr:pilus assembly protein PilM [Thermodesulfovibrionales bacterium]
MFTKKTPTIGLDIGSSHIKGVQLKSVGKGRELLKFDIQPIKSGLIENGVIVDKKSLTDYLHEFFRKANFIKNKAVIGLSGQHSLFIKRITVPLMTEDELRLSIKYEAQQHIPLDLDALALDFHIIGKVPHSDNEMEVLLVAVKKDLLQDYVEVVQNVGLEVVIVDINLFALSNMFEFNYGVPEERNVALVDVGANITSLCVIQRGLPIFWREIPTGSNYHTEALERTFNLTREDAERLKRGHPIEGFNMEEAKSVMLKASDEIYAEIYRSLEVFRSNFYNEDVSKIFLSGGASLIKDFATMLSHRIDIIVEVIDPFKKVLIPQKLIPQYIKEIAPIASIAVGLALREIEV